MANQEVMAAGCCCCISIVVMFIVMTTCFKTVLPTEVAVEYNWIYKTVQSNPIVEPGLHIRGPWKEFITYPKTIQNIAFDKSHYDILDGRTADGLPIIVGVTLQYALIPEEIVDLYLDFEYETEDYLQLFKIHAIHVITEEACQHSATEFFNDKIAIAESMHQKLDTHFRKHLHARVDALQLNSEELPEDFTTTVLNASAMRQNITKAVNTVSAQIVVQATNRLVAVQEAAQMIQQATGNSSLISNTGEADANILSIFQDAEREMYGAIADNLTMSADELLAYIWFDAVGDGNVIQTGDSMEVFSGINPGAYIKE